MAKALFNKGAENPTVLTVTDQAAGVRIHVRQSAVERVLFDPEHAGPQLYPSFDPKGPLAPIEKTVRGALRALANNDPKQRPDTLTHEEEFDKPIGVDPYVMLPVGTEIGTDEQGRPIRLTEATQLPEASNDPKALFDMLSNGLVPGRRCAGYRIVDDPLDGMVPATFMRAWLRRVDEEPQGPNIAELTQKTFEAATRPLEPHDPTLPPMVDYEVIGLQPHQNETHREPQQEPLVGVRIFDRMKYLNWLHGSPGSKGDVSRRFDGNAARPTALGTLPAILKWKLPPTRHPQPSEFRLAMHARELKKS